MKPHKHANLIKQWADGAIMQFKDSSYKDDWTDCIDNKPSWSDCYEYRVKPEKWSPDFEDNVFKLRSLLFWVNEFYPEFRMKLETDVVDDRNGTIAAVFYVDNETMLKFENMRYRGEIDL